MKDYRDAAPIEQRHQWNPKTGNCTCGWEPDTDRGAEQQHNRHVDRLHRGLPS